MGSTPDLTFAQIHAKCNNSKVAEYIASMSVLPIGISVTEFLAIFLQAACVAQISANDNNLNVKADQKLNAYPLPTTSIIMTDTTNNLQYYTATYKLNFVVGIGEKTNIVAAYI
ncbi:hypothetical protein [Nostoc sp.]|uniref:hypothetical protein n=1 Tax=Nostoc sp. TaxID=1180 RepID=UPI002FF83E54